MDYVMRLNIFYALHKLSDYDTSLTLRNSFPQLEQTSQVKAVGILLDHVNFCYRLDSLVMSDWVLTTYEAVDFYLFEN